MDFISALGQRVRSDRETLRVFDWNKAARIIKERNATSAAAGLNGDWEWTGGDILEDGRPVPRASTYTYLASIWATPELAVDGEIIACWIDETEADGWDAKTYWPDSALAILAGE